MPPLEPSPVATARQNAVLRLLDVFVLVVLLFHAGRRLASRLEPHRAVRAPPPLAIDLGRDGVSRLVHLPGIGARRAASIVEDRRRHGPVRSLSELTRISGIGPETVRRIRAAKEVRVVVPPPPLSAEDGAR